MDLAQMKAAVTMEGVLSGTAALELIAEVERLISLCAEYRGEVDPLKDRITALECEVEESRALCDGYRGEVAELKVVEARVEHIKRSYAGGENWLRCLERAEKAESALTRARAEGMEEACGVISGILAEVHGYGVTRALTRASDTIRARATKGDSDEG